MVIKTLDASDFTMIIYKMKAYFNFFFIRALSDLILMVVMVKKNWLAVLDHEDKQTFWVLL